MIMILRKSEGLVDVRPRNVKEESVVKSPRVMATGNSRFEGNKFPVLFWKNHENSRLELMY